MATLARDRNDRPDLDTLQATLTDWSTRWTEPAWPVPALGRYLDEQTKPPVPESQVVGDRPPRVYDTTRIAAVSEMESGNRPTEQSDEVDPELAKSRG
jgi:hypothetical protein